MDWILVICLIALIFLVLTIGYVIFQVVRGHDVELGKFYGQVLYYITFGIIAGPSQ